MNALIPIRVRVLCFAAGILVFPRVQQLRTLACVPRIEQEQNAEVAASRYWAEGPQRFGTQDMSSMHAMDSSHLRMTHPRVASPGDTERAQKIVTRLRASLEKYKDYRVALQEGFQVFLPDFPQAEYHFTNYRSVLNEVSVFDPAHPSSLLYKKNASGYELVGGMYTMPRSATEDDLNERVPLSVARWHLHTNICLPPSGARQNADWTKFGAKGSIATKEACDRANGTFLPVIFGWMVHVYPFEDSVAKAFAMHHFD